MRKTATHKFFDFYIKKRDLIYELIWLVSQYTIELYFV